MKQTASGLMLGTVVLPQYENWAEVQGLVGKIQEALPESVEAVLINAIHHGNNCGSTGKNHTINHLCLSVIHDGQYGDVETRLNDLAKSKSPNPPDRPFIFPFTPDEYIVGRASIQQTGRIEYCVYGDERLAQILGLPQPE